MAQFTHRLAELAENPDRHPHAPPSALFDALGFRWDGSAIPSGIATHSIERVCFRCHKMLPEFVWDASVLEGNPFTFPEVQTVLAGVTVGGRKISDQTITPVAKVASRQNASSSLLPVLIGLD